MWIYKRGKIEKIEDFGNPPPFGFIYIVTHISSGKKYLGKKVLYHNKKVPVGKKALAKIEGRGRRPSKKLIIKESDWKTYYGSNAEIMKMIEEGKKGEFKREIIDLAKNKKHLTYLETKYLFMFEVLDCPGEWYNDHILGKFYRGDFS